MLRDLLMQVVRPSSAGADSHRTRGDRKRDQGQLREAIAAYDLHLARHPEDFDIWVQRGNCLKDVADYTAAAESYLAAIRINPDDSDVHLQRGHLAKLIGNQDEARNCYERALLLDRSNHHARDELLRLQNSVPAASTNLTFNSLTLARGDGDAKGERLQQRLSALKSKLVKI